MAGARELNFRLGDHGGSDGARTRDLRRDRPSVYLMIPTVVPTFSTPGQAHFEAKSERPITGIPGCSCAAGSIQADGIALPGRSHAERPVQASLCDKTIRSLDV